MRSPGLATSLRYRARRLRSRLGLAGLWAADRLEALADTVAVGLLRAEGLTWGTGPVGILRPVVPPRQSPTGLARRNDLLAIRAIAERRPRASTWAVDIVLLELREHGASVTIAGAEQIARRIICASTYQPRVSDGALDPRD